MTEAFSEGASRHPPPEQLAALLDARLPAEERTETIRHLARCTECRDLVADSVAFLEEEEEAEVAGEGKVLRTRRWFRRPLTWALLSAAAVVTLLVTVPGPWAPPPRLDTARLSDALAPPGRLRPALTATFDAHPWSEWRATPGGPLPPEHLWFRAGVRSLELEVALAADDATTARQLATRLAELFGAVDGAEPLVVSYTGEAGIHAQLDGSRAPHELLPIQRQADAMVRSAFAGSPTAAAYELGRWAAAAKLSAASGETAFLESAASQDLLRDVARRDLDAEVLNSVRRLRELASEGAADSRSDIRAELDRLIRHAGGATTD